MNSQIRKITLTGATQVISLVQNNSALRAIPKLAQITSIDNSPRKCNCKKGTSAAAKQQVENILTSLSPQDFADIKRILSLDQLCYYQRNLTNNNLELVCI